LCIISFWASNAELVFLGRWGFNGDLARNLAFFSAVQSLKRMRSGHNLGLFAVFENPWLAQKLQCTLVNFSIPFYSGEFDGQDRRRCDEHGERQRSQVR
jgi:hypothetical protein